MHAYEMIIPKRTRGDFVMKTTLMSLRSRGFVYHPFRSGGSGSFNIAYLKSRWFRVKVNLICTTNIDPTGISFGSFAIQGNIMRQVWFFFQKYIYLTRYMYYKKMYLKRDQKFTFLRHDLSNWNNFFSWWKSGSWSFINWKQNKKILIISRDIEV